MASLSSAAPSGSAAATPNKSRSGRFLTPTERLPKGLPDWFLAKDVNGQGQITMAEFATEWTPETAAEFDRYDLNHDGIITAAEVLKVEAQKTDKSATSRRRGRQPPAEEHAAVRP